MHTDPDAYIYIYMLTCMYTKKIHAFIYAPVYLNIVYFELEHDLAARARGVSVPGRAGSGFWHTERVSPKLKPRDTINDSFSQPRVWDVLKSCILCEIMPK